MGGQPDAADWEYIVGRDLVPHLIPGGQRQGAHWPDGARAALSDSVGHVGPDGLLVLPEAAWRWHRSRRRSLYTPLSVAGIGEQGVGLWVRALPAPGVRVQLPFSGIAAIEHHVDGSSRTLIVTGQAERLLVRYRADGRTGAEAWIRRLRLRAAPVPAPVPPAPSRDPGPRGCPNPESLLLHPGDEFVSAAWRSRTHRTACLLAVTARELVIAQSLPGRGLPGPGITRTLYVPRQALRGATARAGSLCLRSADTDVEVGLWSGRAAVAASCWLRQVLASGEAVRWELR